MAGPQFPYWMVQNVGAAGAPYGQSATDIAKTLTGAGQGALDMYNQYAPGFMSGAAGQGAQAQQAGDQLSGAYAPLQQGAGQVMQTAFDPQQALYARTAQQLQDQTRAAESARGIGMTPYGAGVEGQTMANFNIDWQNQQLQRQLQGLAGAGSALGQYGAGVTGAQELGMQGAQFPISAMGSLFGAQNQGVAPMQSAASDYLQQQQLAQQAAQQQNQLLMDLYQMQNQQYQQGQQQQMQGLSGLGSILGTVGGDLFSSATKPWWLL